LLSGALYLSPHWGHVFTVPLFSAAASNRSVACKTVKERAQHCSVLSDPQCQGYTNFLKVYDLPQNSRHHKGDVKPRTGPANLRRRRTKLVATTNWSPIFVCPRLIILHFFPLKFQPVYICILPVLYLYNETFILWY
jgi:hypothetical protein